MIAREVLQESINDNLSTYEIAKELGFSQTNVRYWMRKHGLRASFGPHGEGRQTKTTEEKAAKVVEYVMKHRKRVKAAAISYKGGKCQICGYNRCQNALEFHHVDKAAKAFGLSKNGWTKS